MNIDPSASRVTTVFMVLALVVMAALAWSVARDRNPADPMHPEAKSTAPAETDAAP